MVIEEDVCRDPCKIRPKLFGPGAQLCYRLELLPKALETRREGLEERCQQPVCQSSPDFSQQRCCTTPELVVILSYHAVKQQVSCSWFETRTIANAGSRYYNAHETGAMEPLALALACGDAEFKVSSSPRCLNHS